MTASQFVRDTGCTESEWLGWLPGAVGAHRLSLRPQGAEVQIGAGRLELRWQDLPARRIALLSLPRIEVRYAFFDVGEPERDAFMRHFDLFMQRGGG